MKTNCQPRILSVAKIPLRDKGGIKAFSNPIKDQAVENFRLVTEKMVIRNYWKE